MTVVGKNNLKVAVLLLALLFVFVIPMIANAQLVHCRPCGLNDIFIIIANVVNFLVQWIAVPIAGVSYAFAGIYYIAGSANEAHRSTAKDILTMTTFGLVLVMGAWLIVNAILVGLGSSVPIP